ncbi:MAG: hypothetical protein ACFUZC_16040 [Chthoniobacteraceae bacterium]
MQQNVFLASALAAGLWLGLPATGQAQGLQLKPGWNYAIAFPDNGNGNGGGGPSGNGNGNGAPAQNPNNSATKGVALYKVLGAADQNWYRVRPIARSPQGALMPIPGSAELWVNLSYAMWVQEVMR